MIRILCIFTLFLGAFAQLPTLYEYYTSDGITSGLSVDQPYFTLNGKNITIFGGTMHYFRMPPQYWRDRLKKLRAAGLNAVETYIAWNIHEPKNGTFEFGQSGTELQMFADLEGFLQIAQEEDLLVLLRPGPYICGEWEWGGFPSWLLRADGIRVRTSDPIYMSYVERYFGQLLPLLARYQFTRGGPIVLLQVENEYGFSPQIDPDYMQQLYDLMKSNDIVELLTTTDGSGTGSSGSLPGLVFQTVDLGSNPGESFSILDEIQPGKPYMVMEFYPGWTDHWAEDHHTLDPDTFRANYEETISYPASTNLYMFHGGTSWGFLNGANNGPGDNSEFQPDTTSYDYDAPLTEAGDYTVKYDIIRELVQQYNPIQTFTPDPPELVEREVYPTLTIDGQLSLNDLLDQASDTILTSSTLPMEQLPINDDNGQSYGYIVYHQDSIDIPANSVLTITGHVRDTVIVLINGVSISSPLYSSSDFEGFGYWRLADSTITLTSTDLTGATLDLVIENWGRVNFWNLYEQFKGLAQDNRVFLNDEELTSWVVFPLEFKKSWTSNLGNWSPADELQPAPALYKATLTIDEEPETYCKDTFIDMREWNKGVVIVNGFVLGRYASHIGPQQTLYLPGPFLQQGDNEILIFEHFEPATEVTFIKDSIFNTP